MFGKKQQEIELKNEELLGRVIDQHTARLLDGKSGTAELVAEHEEILPELSGILSVANGLFSLLEPVEPSSQFLASLKAELLNNQQQRIQLATRWTDRQQRIDNGTRIFSKVMSVVAVTAIVAHVIGSVVMIIMFIVGLGRRRNAATV